MRVPIAAYSGAKISELLACSAAIATRTGFHACLRPSRYSSGTSLFSLSTARLITWKLTSISRTFSTSRIHREVIQHHGHSGSNQKSATDFSGIAAWSSRRRHDSVQHNRAPIERVPAATLCNPSSYVVCRLTVLSGVSTCCALWHLTAFDVRAHHERSG